ncbi:MAG: SpoIIE family protein phosphatase [Spirochaetales bacterium]|nr:SpoIIE family protein phosphatase [Spirochaetales bacterium]
MENRPKKSFFIWLIFLIVLPLIAIIILATISFIMYQHTISFNEFLIRGELLTKQAAHLAEKPILEESFFDLIDAIEMISKEKDVVQVHVIDTKGMIIESSNHRMRKNRSVHTLIRDFTWKDFGKGNVVHFLYPIFGGVKGFTCVELSKKRMNDDLRNISVIAMIFLVLFIVLSIFISFLISRSIIKPINSLQVTFKEVSEGNLLAPIDITRTDELGNLARSFSQTRDEIVKHINELKRKERIDKEMEIAASVQRFMLPEKAAYIRDYDSAAVSIPAGEVGGDFYDILPIDRENFLLIIGDVSGKGLQSALYLSTAMSILSTAVHDFIIRGANAATFSPLTMLKILNDVLMSKMKRTNFVTAFLGVLNTREHVFRYANSGHEPAILYNPKTGTYEELKTEGQACGIVRQEQYVTTLEEGTALVGLKNYLLFYTNGVTDVRNKNNESYRSLFLDRIKKIEGDETADAIVSGICKSVEDFLDGEPRSDDLTIVCLKRLA